MKEEKIKSALEIAMEKLSGLPELTREEIEEQRKKEYGPVGDGIAKKYLSGMISDSELPLELAKYSGAPAGIVRHALAAALCRELRLENDREISGKALRGLRILASGKSESAEKIEGEFRRIFDEFIKKKEEKSRQFKLLAIESLKKLGIGGSAIRPNLNEDAHWKKHLREIQNLYGPRLEDIRHRLMKEVR